MSQPTIPGYRVLRSLSESKRGQVYLAEQQSLQRMVALKVLSGEVNENEASRRRVIDEGKAAARLTHPNLLSVFDIGEHEGRYYIATEYVSGGTLRDKLASPLSAVKALQIARDLATGLKFLHNQGFLHRDIKPTNVMFREDGTALLGEAGVARSSGKLTPENEQVAFGSPHYMSPERAQAMPSDVRSDLYSLGVVLWEMLTSKPPFDAEDPFQVAIKHISEPVPALPLPLAVLQPMMAKCLAKQPEQRYNGASELLTAIDAALVARGVNPGEAKSKSAAAPSRADTDTKPVDPVPAPSAPPAPAKAIEPVDMQATAVMSRSNLPQVPAPAAASLDQSSQATRAITPIAPRPPVPDLGATMVAAPIAPPTPNAPVMPPAVPRPPVPDQSATVVSAAPFAPPLPEPRQTAPVQPLPPPEPFAAPGQPLSNLPQYVDPAKQASYSAAKRSSAAGWLIWLGVIGLLCAAAAGWWVLKGSKQAAPLAEVKPTSGQLSGSQSNAPVASAVVPKASLPVSNGSSGTNAGVESLLEQAKIARANGDLVTPAGGCAAMYAQRALQFDPQNVDAQLEIESIASEVEEKIAAMIEDGTLTSAKVLNEAALQFFADRPVLLEQQKQLAN